jgi:5-methylthioadenosine/S-adenosylhomocysteine deaminase
MARTLVVGDPLVTMAEPAVIADGALAVAADGTVERVGPRVDLEADGPYERTVGSPRHAVLPGFVNGHFHSEGMLGQGLWELIFERANCWVHGVFGPISEEDLYAAVMVGLLDAVRGGQTCLVDHFYGNPNLPDLGAGVALQAHRDLGIRAALGLVLRDRNRYAHEDDAAFLARLPPELAREVRASPMGYAWPVDEVLGVYDRLVRRWDGDEGRLRVILAPDWTTACSDDLYRRCRRLADEYGTGITTHVLETRSEMSFNLEHHGVTAVRRLAELGVLGPDLSCSHSVWFTDEDIELMAASGAVAVTNPGSNLRLSTGIARVRDMLAAGVAVAVGTDIISFSDREDYLAELRLAAYLQRVPLGLESGRLDSEAFLRSAYAAGARAARMEERLGKLAPGQDADLVVLSRERLFWPARRYALSPPLDVILDRADATDITDVLVKGRPVLSNGVVRTVNETAVRSRYQDACERRLWERDRARQRSDVELPLAVEPYVLDFYRTWTEHPVAPANVYNTRTGPLEGHDRGAHTVGGIPTEEAAA